MEIDVVEAMLDALSRRDTARLDALCTDDYVLVTPRGTQTKAEMRANEFPEDVFPTFEIVDHDGEGGALLVRVRRTMNWRESGEVASVDEQQWRFTVRGEQVARSELVA